MSHRGSGKPYGRTSSGRGLPDGQWLHDKAPGAERTRAPRAPDATMAPASSTRLLVDNLHYEVTEKDLATLFGVYGPFAKPPRIRFDKSGRSTGSGTVTFENMDDAKAAQKALNKQLAKGQELAIRFDHQSGSNASSLLARLDKGSTKPLASRLADSPKGTTGEPIVRGVGPHRRGRGGARGAANTPREKRPHKKPLTADDLDKELDQYGAQGDGSQPAPQAGPVSGPSTKAVEEDVEMS
ncbi:hypothetical protein PIIN_07685 [Serendipita indica DSM 11827]|uniref:RRM domain-containing protein n=1 Tax=Serendipita indica (strain DSM 11827) TaxID=1109443 RepID=G4TQY7_SERID|nr:hypothetical protein PIIN_07685 [Serendipita indica DSM 11827]